MVDKLFASSAPNAFSRLLDPGCGPGAFVDGVLRWCSARGIVAPQIVGVDSNPIHVATAHERFAGNDRVEIRHADFLSLADEPFDYVIGNPPYVAITGLSEAERNKYRKSYTTATSRFDLYVLFFEQALRQLRPGGRLVFITPEKFLYVESAATLRRLLARRTVEELHFLGEDTFADLVTYPLVTTIGNSQSDRGTSVVSRDGVVRQTHLDSSGGSWLPSLSARPAHHGSTLADIAVRISCGVATGADADFVIGGASLPAELRPYSYPTVSGRQLIRGREIESLDWMLIPYDAAGRLLPESSLGALGHYLSRPERRARLLGRTCARTKPWYAFHENPPMQQLLRPKLLCKDIGSAPFFFLDRAGTIIPRHSVYYILPHRPHMLGALASYLNSEPAQQWLLDNCQRAAKGFVRLQSHVLKRLPIPATFDTQAVLGIGLDTQGVATA